MPTPLRPLALFAALFALVAAAPAGQAQDLDGTISAVQGGLTNLAPAAAVENIDGWIAALEGSDEAIFRNLAADLEDLKMELTKSEPSGRMIGRALMQVGQRTSVSSFYAEGMTAQKLSVLGSALTRAGKMLAGQGGM
jgi:hypothetical protein